MKESKYNEHLVMAAHVSDKTHNEGDKDLQDDATSSAAPNDTSRLSILLACRDFIPTSIMEHEKILLVMKEHDYAGVPQLTRMAPLLHNLASGGSTNQLLAMTNTELPSSSPTKKNKDTARSLLLSSVCHALADNRRDMLTGGSDGLMSHFKEMISLQSILLHELQEQIQIKDIESNTVHREKEQLKARLERMERRMSILQKHSSKDKPETSRVVVTSDDSTLEASPVGPSSPLRPDYVTRLTRLDSLMSNSSSTGRRRKSRSRSSSTEPSATSRRVSRQSLPSTPPINSLEISHRAVYKRELDDEESELASSKRHRSSLSSNSDNKKATQQDSYLRTEIPYTGLCLDLPTATSNSSNDRGHMKEAEKPSIITPSIRVPTWRERKPSLSKEVDKEELVINGEDTSDDIYAKRTSKLETDEKRRKRWDAQRIREQFQHKQLMKRYMIKEGIPPTQEKKKEKLTTFQPKLDNCEGIELNDTVVVSGFGRPLPKLPPNSFRLANFNPHTAVSRGGRGKVGRSRQNSSTSNSVSEGSSHVT